MTVAFIHDSRELTHVVCKHAIRNSGVTAASRLQRIAVVLDKVACRYDGIRRIGQDGCATVESEVRTKCAVLEGRRSSMHVDCPALARDAVPEVAVPDDHLAVVAKQPTSLRPEGENVSGASHSQAVDRRRGGDAAGYHDLQRVIGGVHEPGQVVALDVSIQDREIDRWITLGCT